MGRLGDTFNYDAALDRHCGNEAGELVVVQASVPDALSRHKTDCPRLRQVLFGDLDPPLVRTLGTATVVSELASDAFDCLEVAERLEKGGFRGRFVIIARGLPRPELVRNEIAQQCPALDFDLIALPAATCETSDLVH